MIVVDTSAALEVLLQTPAASRIEVRLFAPGETLHAPQLLDLEVVHVVRRYEAARVIDAQASRRVTMSLGRYSWQRCSVLCDPHTFKNSVVWSFALILAWREPASYNE